MLVVLAQAVGQNCGFRRSLSLFMAAKPRDVSAFPREYEAHQSGWFAVQWLDGQSLLARWGLVGLAAIESESGASS